MPQMAPLSWIFLFSLFICLYILASVKIYFSKNKNNLLSESQMKTSSSIKNLNWKW